MPLKLRVGDKLLHESGRRARVVAVYHDDIFGESVYVLDEGGVPHVLKKKARRLGTLRGWRIEK